MDIFSHTFNGRMCLSISPPPLYYKKGRSMNKKKFSKISLNFEVLLE